MEKIRERRGAQSIEKKCRRELLNWHRHVTKNSGKENVREDLYMLGASRRNERDLVPSAETLAVKKKELRRSCMCKVCSRSSTNNIA